MTEFIVTLMVLNNRLIRIFVAAVAGGAVGIGAFLAVQAGNVGAATAEQPCLSPAAWTMLDDDQPRIISATAVLASMAKRDVVLLGEQHDEDDDHRWQVQVLAALHAQRPNMVIGFEMFPRRVQPALDDWVAGKLTVKEFVDRSEWASVWQMPIELYLPLFQFARINRVPMAALNIDAKLAKSVSEKGWDAIPQGEREGVGRPAPASEGYRDFLFEVYSAHPNPHGTDDMKARKTDSAFGRFVEAQTVWDRAMAEALARYLRQGSAGEQPLVVGIMGSGHIRFGYGVPHQLRDLNVKNVGTLLPVGVGLGCKELKSGLADAVFALPETATPKTDPPRLGVRLEEKDGTVRIVDVTAGSLAERTGLKAGDEVVEVAGLPAKRNLIVIAAIRMQPAGTWLPIRVKRGHETMELVIKFPARQ